jgi:putative ABC transport system permease protein
MLQVAWHDVRYGMRMLLKTPGVTFAALLMLALGIGVNTTLFSTVKTVLLSSLPYSNPERLVTLASADHDTVNPITVSYGLREDWKQRSRSFESISLFRDWAPTETNQGQPEVLTASRISQNLLPMLGISPFLGRNFLPEEDRPDRRYEVLLSYGFWRDKFGGSREVIGSKIRLNETSYEIVGVLPANFEPLFFSAGAKAPQIWAPLGYDASQPIACRSCQHLRAVARLKSGVTIESARAEMNTIATQLAKEFPNDYPLDSSVRVTALHTAIVGRVSSMLWLLMAATGFVLLITCANIANLMLVRAATRRREMAVRAALGAGRKRLLAQLLAETLLLTVAGGAAGVLVAVWGVSALQSWSPTNIPRLEQVRVDSAVLSFSLAVSVLVGVLAGIVPAMQSAGCAAREALQSAGRGAIGAGRGKLRSVLVVVEIGMAFILAISTGLLVRSLGRIVGVHPGFEATDLHTAAFNLIGPKYQKPEESLQFEEAYLERIRQVPGIENVAMVSTLPLGGGFDRRGFHIKDRVLAGTAEAPDVDAYYVTPGYFDTMRIPFLKGRGFTEGDAAVAASAPVAIISESTAKHIWPGENPLGKAIQLGGREEDKPWAVIVGIVGDVRQTGLDAGLTADAYLLESQNPSGGGTLVVRSSLDSAQVSRALEQQAAALDKNTPVYDEATMVERISVSLAQRRFIAALVGGFCGLAMLLACIGIYGVMSYVVSQRSNEIGVRMAIGAQSSQILRMIFREGTRLVLFGGAFGLAGAIGLGRFLKSQLFEVSLTDPLTYALVGMVLAAAAFLACAIPALRATRVDPMEALRYE